MTRRVAGRATGIALAGLASLAVPAVALVPAAPDPSVAIAGRWLTVEGKAIVEIAPCPAATPARGAAPLCGRLARIIRYKPGGPRVDVNNPDASLRGRPIQGLTILSGFTQAGDRWKGRIYDPESGRSYRSELTRAGGTLHVKGCLGPFCRTQDWTRAS